jgi:FtsP/CotA-like multicopper oxidase with cupredoxin domain
MGRRKFLGVAGLGLGAASLTALTAKGSAANASSVPPVSDPFPRQEEAVDWREIDRLHKEAVDTFVAQIDPEMIGFHWGAKGGTRDKAFTMSDDGFKVFDITCKEVEWDTGGGQVFPAFTYDGIVPGPVVRLTVGDKVRFNVTNEMSESTSMHFHGMTVPNAVDGVTYVTNPPIEPGQTLSYEFEVKEAGSFMYHSHHNAAEQTVRGLLGALIVEPADLSGEPEVAGDYIMVLNDSGLGYTINGMSFPYTQPIVANLGDRIRVRIMNEGLMIHPMHLHGIVQFVTHKDGHALASPYKVDTINIAPGERYDLVIDLTEPGLWAWHCHILTHAESRQGLHGMTTVIVVNAPE